MTVATALAVSWKPLTNSKPRAMRRATPRRMKGKIEAVVDDGEIGDEAVRDVDQADGGHDGEEDDSPFADGGFRHLGVEERAVGLGKGCVGRKGSGSCGHVSRLRSACRMLLVDASSLAGEVLPWHEWTCELWVLRGRREASRGGGESRGRARGLRVVAERVVGRWN